MVWHPTLHTLAQHAPEKRPYTFRMTGSVRTKLAISYALSCHKLQLKWTKDRIRTTICSDRVRIRTTAKVSWRLLGDSNLEQALVCYATEMWDTPNIQTTKKKKRDGTLFTFPMKVMWVSFCAQFQNWRQLTVQWRIVTKPQPQTTSKHSREKRQYEVPEPTSSGYMKGEN